MANPFLVQPAQYGQALGSLGQSLNMFGQQQQQNQAIKDEKQSQLLAKQEMDAALQELGDAYTDKDYDAINRIALRYPEQAESARDALSDDQRRQQDNIIDVGFKFIQNPQDYERLLDENPIFAEQVGGRDLAVQRMQADPEKVIDEVSGFLAFKGGDKWKQYQEFRDGGEQPIKTQRQKEWEQYTSLKESDPEGAIQFGRSAGFVSKEGKETEPSKTANAKDWQTYKDLKQTNPDEAEQFGRKVGFVSKEGLELSPGLQKRLSVATDEAIESERAANSADTLADDFERMNISGGLISGKWSESLKDITGTQDAVTNLRKRYNAVRSSQAVKNLPPGVASDKDIELALSGFPSENANASQVASFMRGVAKMERERAKYASFRADYISEGGTERGMLKEWKNQQEKTGAKTVNWADL